MLKRKNCCIILASVALFGIYASAEVTVTYSADKPSKNVLTDFAPVPEDINGLQWRANDNNGRRDVGQSFLVSADTVMVAFSFQSYGNLQGGAARAPFTVRIYESRDESTIGKIISTQSGTYLTPDSSIAKAWVTFNLEKVPLKANRYYTVTLAFDRSNVYKQEQVFCAAAKSDYPKGRNWRAEDGAPFAYRSVISGDLAFSVQVLP
ncbi:MAG: hypothetical protein WC959_05080 [Kiritimatiellales bacterium]